MCGRYTLHSDKSAIEAALGAELPEAPEPDYNIGPGRPVLVARREANGDVKAEHPHWGRRDRGHFVINARLETADRIPLFREAWRASRCVLPADGFYEWRREDGRKTPFYFRPEGGGLFLLAGLLLPSLEFGSRPDCIVLTTAANPAVAAVHHRMPVALAPSRKADWLNGSLDRKGTEDVAATFAWTAHPASTQVNAVRHNDPSLIQPASPPEDPQLPLL